MAIRAFSFGYIHGHKVGGTNPTLVEALHLKNKVFAFRSIFNKELVDETCLFSSSQELSGLLLDGCPKNLNVKNMELYTWEHVCNAYANIMERK